MLCFLFVLLDVELLVLVYGKYDCIVMQILCVCVLCAPCSRCGINAGQACKR